MEIPTEYESFDEWERRERAALIAAYRAYLRHVLDDDGFDETQTEDYWNWARVEFESLCA